MMIRWPSHVRRQTQPIYSAKKPHCTIKVHEGDEKNFIIGDILLLSYYTFFVMYKCGYLLQRV